MRVSNLRATVVTKATPTFIYFETPRHVDRSASLLEKSRPG